MAHTLTDLYRSILDSLNAVSDATGLISIRNDDDDYIPCTINNMRLALPTDLLLNQGDWEGHGLQPFHPLSEHLNRGESAVLKKLRMLIQVKLVISYQELLQCLVRLCADKKQHASVTPKGAAILQLLPAANEKTVQDFDKILEAAAMKGIGNVIKIYLRRGGQYDGRRVPRLCVVRFPLIEEFEGDTMVVHGVKLSKKDFNGLRALLEYVTPKHDKIETYGAGSVSDYAPYFDALTRAYIKTAERLNSLIHLYRKHMDNEDQLKINLSWVEDFEDLGKYRHEIPPLSGNEGEIVDEGVAGYDRAVVGGADVLDTRRRLRETAATTSPTRHSSTSTSTPTPAPATTFDADAVSRAMRTPSHVPSLTPVSEPQRSGGGRTFAELEAERNKTLYAGQVPMQPMQPQMPSMPGMYPGFQYGQPTQPMQPMMGYPMPGMYPQQMMQQPMMPMGGAYPPMYPNQGYPAGGVMPMQYGSPFPQQRMI